MLQTLYSPLSRHRPDLRLITGSGLTIGSFVKTAVYVADNTPLAEEAARYTVYEDADAQFMAEAGGYLFGHTVAAAPAELLLRKELLRQIGPLSGAVLHVAIGSQNNGILTDLQVERLKYLEDLTKKSSADRLLNMAVIRPLRERLIAAMITSVGSGRKGPIVNLSRSLHNEGAAHRINAGIQRENINRRVPAMTRSQQRAVRRARSYGVKLHLHEPFRVIGKYHRQNVEAIDVRAYNTASRRWPKTVVRYDIDALAAGENRPLVSAARHLLPFAYYKANTGYEEAGFVADPRHLPDVDSQVNFINTYGQYLFGLEALQDGSYERWCEEHDTVVSTTIALQEYAASRMREF